MPTISPFIHTTPTGLSTREPARKSTSKQKTIQAKHGNVRHKTYNSVHFVN